MKNLASILGLVLPSALCVALTLSFKHELCATTSGEVAANLIAGGLFSVLLGFVLSCILNLVCLVVAVRRREPLWNQSALGIPLCAVLTTLTALLIK